MFIAESLHGKAAFQHVLPQLVYYLLEFLLESRAVQFLRTSQPPCVPKLVTAAAKVHADMSDGPQPFVLGGKLPIKNARLIEAGGTDMELRFFCRVWDLMHLAELPKRYICFIEKAKLIPCV